MAYFNYKSSSKFQSKNVEVPSNVVKIEDKISQVSVSLFEKSVQTEETHLVKVVQVYSPSFFWIIKDSFSQEFNILMLNLKNYYPGNKHLLKIPPSLLEIDLDVAHEHNGDWYRAKILKILPNNLVNIFLIDFGCVETCHVNDVYFLAKGYHFLKGIAMPCSLYGVEPFSPEGWSEDACKYFTEKVSGKILHASVAKIEVEKNSMVLALIDTVRSNDINITGLLLDNKFAKLQTVNECVDPYDLNLYTETYIKENGITNSCLTNTESKEISDLTSETDSASSFNENFISTQERSESRSESNQHNGGTMSCKIYSSRNDSMMKIFNENGAICSKTCELALNNQFKPKIYSEMSSSSSKLSMEFIELSDKKNLWIFSYQEMIYTTVDQFRTSFTPFVNNDLIIKTNQFCQIPFKWISKLQDTNLYDSLLKNDIVPDQLLPGILLMPLKTKYIFEILTKLSIINASDWFDYESDEEYHSMKLTNIKNPITLLLADVHKLIKVTRSFKRFLKH